MGERLYVTGTDGDDVLVGTDQTNDQITGKAGNDIMRGLGDMDLLIGGLGDDVYDGGDGEDYAIFLYAAQAVQVDLAISAPQNTGEGRDTFISIENVIGSNYADTLLGDNKSNYLSGGLGNDIIDGRAGNDILYGDDGNDLIHGGSGADDIQGGDGDDQLFGDDGDDIFFISGGSLGNELIDGGAGIDRLVFLSDRAGISIDLAITGRQEIAWLQYVTLKDVEQVDGTAYGDNIAGDAKDNLFIGDAGNDFIDGRGGMDTVLLSGSAADFVVSWTVDGWRIVDQRTDGFTEGVDMVKNIEWLQFGSGESRALGDGMTELVAGLLRLAGSAGSKLSADLSSRLEGGTLTPARALAELIAAADSTTSVATMTYQFFTGKIPTQGGVDFLIAPTGPNPTNLNSGYYAQFDTVNRYINFAVNLGKNGEAKDGFTAKYGAMTLFDVTREAYKAIFGGTPTDAKVHALIDGRVDYLAYYGGDGATGIGTKAAMVGFLLAAAATENLGVIAKSNDAWLTDLADGSAPFAVNILDPAAGYWKSDFVFGG